MEFRTTSLIIFLLLSSSIIYFLSDSKNNEYDIIQCDEDKKQAREYIEMGALERQNLYNEQCDEFIRLDRYTDCYSLKCSKKLFFN